jgi:3'(2'), 5'-bisphosphate nucleotidase
VGFGAGVLELMQLVSQSLLNQVVAVCEQAGEAIMTVYRAAEGFDVDYKSDNSPLTQADLAAHKILLSVLPTLLDDTPVLSEESSLPPYSERRHWQCYWLIDPLDGTKEFINRNGEFTVNVALIERGQPILGVVHVPVQGITYTGAQTLGAVKIEAQRRQMITVRSLASRLAAKQPVAVVASRRHGSDALQSVLTKIRQNLAEVETFNMGSSLKFCLVAEGRADFYPRLAPTSEWDTAAAQAVVEAAGGMVVDTRFQALRYNQKSDILNPHFYVIGDKDLNWQNILA